MRRAVLLSLVLFVGCTDEDRGALEGDYLVVKSCREGIDVVFEPYKMNGVFFAIQQLGEVAFVRMQPNGKHLDRSDAFIIQINDAEFIKRRMDEAIFLDNAQIRAALHLLGSCPDTTQAFLAANGFIRFSRFGVRKGDRVAAAFEFELIDDRTDELVGLKFSGSFDFVTKVGAPYQPFSGYNEEK